MIHARAVDHKPAFEFVAAVFCDCCILSPELLPKKLVCTNVAKLYDMDVPSLSN